MVDLHWGTRVDLHRVKSIIGGRQPWRAWREEDVLGGNPGVLGVYGLVSGAWREEDGKPRVPRSSCQSSKIRLSH